MTYSFRLARRIARFRAPTLAAIVMTIVACNDTGSLNPDSSSPPGTVEQGAQAASPAAQPELAKSAAAASSRGIPFGFFAQPVTEFGERFTGAMNNISPNQLLGELAATKERGGRVVVMFVGSQKNYKDGQGHFDINKWKSRLNGYKNINFSSYINDGTIIGHYLIDEPNDPANWNGQPISPSTVEEMAKYSKSLWPSMATIARADPAYFKGSYQYLDAAWAQYLSRRGDADSYIARAVSDAQKSGLALIVGLNVLRGGTPNGTEMTSSEVQSFGSALLKNSYPCAFISWKYNSSHLGSGDMSGAMAALRQQAESRSAKSCKGS